MKRQTARAGRRRFLQRAAAAVAAPWIVPVSAVRSAPAAAPSDRITLGMIGIGRMGQGHLAAFLRYDQAQVVAVCDVDQWRRERAGAAVHQVYASTKKSGRFHGCAVYRDLRQLVARPDIDAVVIATGDRWHAVATVLAAAAGKDIYCEKPVSLTIDENRAMISAVRRYGRVFQAGLQQRTTVQFRMACEAVQQGRIGRVRHVYVAFPGTSSDVNLPAEPVPEGLDWDLWLGPAPWRPFNARFHHYGQPHRVVPWHFCRDFGGGNLTSNAVHAFDVVQWALGTDDSGPVEVTPPETGQVPSLTYRYASGTLLHVDWKLDPQKYEIPEGWDPERRIENFGALFVGDDGWIHVGRKAFLKTHPAELLQAQLRQSAVSPVLNHHEDWLEAIRTRRRTACDVSVGCHSTIVSQLGCIAHWTGRQLKWDPARMEFIGDEEANRMRRRAMRSPWRLTA